MNTNTPQKIVKIRDTAAQDIAVDNNPARRKRRRWYIGGSIAVLLLIALATPALIRWAKAERTVSLDQVRIAKVTRGLFVRDVSVDGQVVAAVSPTLYSDVNGTVTLKVVAGDAVKKGQVLGLIDSPELTSSYQQEQSTLVSQQIDLGRTRINSKKAALASQETVDQASVTLEAAKREMKRAEAAWGYHVISEHDYAKAKDDLAAAQLNYDNANANTDLDKQGLDFDVKTKEAQVKREELLVADLKRRYDNLTLRSPVDGMVGNIAVQPRTNVTPNQAIMTVVDLTQMEIQVQIPETYADGLALGMATDISYGGNTYQGKLTAVSPEVQNNLVTGRVRFAGAPPKGMKQNSEVQVRIVMDSRPDVLMVQRGQFLDSGGGNVAYLVHDGIATRTAIHTGAASISQVEILDGLKEGDSIIISDTSGFDTANTVYLK
ncbi:MAG TPA: efflux RND transporter periplasmic adaptor subunit [Gammaproteobacteria bacterium]|jgi:HlyD family secretion protein